MRVKNLRFDPRELHEKAGEMLDAVSLQERKSWAEHPCTKVLILIMQSEMAYSIENWLYSNAQSESIEEAALTNSRLASRAALMEELIDHISDIAKFDYDEVSA